MAPFADRLYDFFVPARYRDDPAELRRARLVVGGSLLISLFSSFFLVQSLAGGFTVGVWAMVFNVVVYLALPFAFRAGLPLGAAGNGLVGAGVVAVVACAYASGGLRSSTVAWLAAFPISSMLLVGRRSGAVWTAVCVGLLGAFLALALTGHAFPDGWPDPERPLMRVGDFAGLILIVFAIARLFEEARHTAEAGLTGKNDELSRALGHLQATQRQLVEQEKLASLGALTAGIAHEIKNPLNFVTNFAGLSKDLVDELTEEHAKNPEARLADVADVLADLRANAERIVEHGRRADAIVRGMLMHARSGTGQRERADLNRLVDEAAGLAYHGMRATRPEVEAAIERVLDPAVGAVEVVPEDVSRVVVNLVSNALYAVAERAAREGAGYAPLVRVETRAVDGGAEVRVCDDGGGVPEPLRARVFEPFFTTKPAGEGTGLGLSLAHDIAVAHGGRLVLAVRGEETTFTLTLPAVNIPDEVAP